MQLGHEHSQQSGSGRRPGRCIIVAIVAALLCGLPSGCAALANPVANGVPVRLLPYELLGESKEGLESVPLSMLRQSPPALYQLDADDILGIWIETILGEKGQPPPVHFPEVGSNLPPAVGYPVLVREDGTISLPLINPLPVRGLTLIEVQEAIRKAYTSPKELLKPGAERIIVSLQKPRTYHILVVRQDVGAPGTQGGGGQAGGATATGFSLSVGGTGRIARKSSGFALDLPAYQNDVLNALTRTGGVPGQDVADYITVERKGTKIRIPLRLRPGEQPKFTPQDIILKSGDTVSVEAREQDVFYTSGILPAGEHALPRDVDLDVVEAIVQCGGTINNGGQSTTNITGTFLESGLGTPSSSLCSVIRKTAGGQQVVIIVDLNKALNDPTERILIQPRDVVMLQQSQEEAIAGYASQLFSYSFTYTVTATKHLIGTLTAAQ